MDSRTLKDLRNSFPGAAAFSGPCKWSHCVNWLVISGMMLAGALAVAQQNQMKSNLAPTPPMGWANWNYYFCNYDEQTIRDQADALVASVASDK